MSILDGELAETLQDALAAFDIPQSAVLVTQVVSGPEWDPTIVDVPHACQAWVDEYDAQWHLNSSVQQNDRKVYVVASSLDVVPTPGNDITFNDVTYGVVSVSADPAKACWVIQARS